MAGEGSRTRMGSYLIGVARKSAGAQIPCIFDASEEGVAGLGGVNHGVCGATVGPIRLEVGGAP